MYHYGGGLPLWFRGCLRSFLGALHNTVILLDCGFGWLDTVPRSVFERFGSIVRQNNGQKGIYLS